MKNILKIFILLSLINISRLFAIDLSITGTVVSYNQKMIGPRYMGYVKNVYYDIGDRVDREDTLFELESAEFDILKNQADLALEQAVAMVDMYRIRLNSIKREKSLLKSRGMVDSSDFENLDMTADNVSASLAAIQVLVNNAYENI
jgi:multidrug resistance efflux pump